MSNIKKVLSLGIAVVALAFVFGFSNTASAATCTMTTGTWDGVAGVSGGGTSTFSSCTGGGTNHPAIGDVIQINAGVTLTISGNASVGGIIIDSPTTADGLTINTAVTVTNSGSLAFTANATANAQTLTIAGTGVLNNATTGTVAAPTGAGDSLVVCSGTGSLTFASTLALTGNSTSTGKASFGMGTCTLSAAGITLTGGSNATGVAELTASTGTITSSASGITFAGTTGNAKITTSGAATLNDVGTISGGGATSWSLTAGTLLKFTGTSAINTAYTSLKNVEVVSGTTTLGAVQTVTGLQVDSGAILAGSTFLLTNTCTSTGVAGFTINGTFSGSGGATLSGVGCTIDGTAGANYTNSGTLTLTGNKTIASTAVLTLPGTVAITATSTVTNNGAITTTGAAGITGAAADSAWTQGTTGVLNFGGATTSLLSTGALTASATGNTVNYNLGAAQTVKVPVSSTYYNLTLSGGSSAIKTFGAAETVTNNITIAASTSVNLTGSSTAKYLIFATSRKAIGSWGFTGSGATHIETTYITGGAGIITAAYGAVSGQTVTAPSHSSVPPVVQPAQDDSSTVTPPAPTTNDVKCSVGEVYSANTGEKCTEWNGNAAVVCTPGVAFSPTTGQRCTSFTGGGSAPAGNAYAFGTVLVKQGSKGGACLAWQTFLNAHGAHLATDGACGKLTMAAARSWQASVGLTADGLLGAKSRAKAMLVP